MRRALVVGGTRGIGLALANKLADLGWDVLATGKASLDLELQETWDLPDEGAFDLVVFSAGDLRPGKWDTKSMADLCSSYMVHAAGPVAFLAHHRRLFPWWAKVVFITSVGARNAGAVDVGYGMAKAALNKAALALAAEESWQVTLVELDLVNTRMLSLLPADTLHGRRIMEPEEAADLIVAKADLA